MTDADIFEIIEGCEKIISDFEAEGVQDLSTVSVMMAVAVKRMKEYVTPEELEELLNEIVTGDSGIALVKETKKEIIH